VAWQRGRQGWSSAEGRPHGLHRLGLAGMHGDARDALGVSHDDDAAACLLESRCGGVAAAQHALYC